ncbi:MAG: phosphate uptake regulator PhoU [Candidatus Nitrosocaldaceae archaeon]
MRYYRKVQKIGSSMLVSLPKEWVIENELSKGSVLLVDVGNDIIIRSKRESKSKEAVINYPSRYGDMPLKEITGAYLLGYDIILVKGENSISYNDRELIKDAIKRLVGLEIIDEDAHNIKAQFLLDATTLDPRKILQRINSIINGMYKDTISSFNNKNDSIMKIIRVRDEEINRQYFLLVRFLRSALLDNTLAERINLTSIDILDYRIAANLFEGVGDSIVELARLVANTKDVEMDVIDTALMIGKLQSLAVNAFLNNNRAYSIQVINEYNTLNNIFEKMKSHKDASTLNIIYMLDRIAKAWTDVADLVKTID